MLLKANPGGKPLAVKPSGVFAPVTVKLNGWPRNATALKALVTTDGAFELPLATLFVGIQDNVLGMISFGWLGLYHNSCACAAPPV